MARACFTAQANARDQTFCAIASRLSSMSVRTADRASGCRNRCDQFPGPLRSSVADRHRASTVFNAIALVIGLVAFGFVVSELGWSGIRHAVLGVGAWFAVIAAIDLASAMCDAFAIHGFLRPKQRVSYFRVLAAQLSGMAINRL